MSPEAKQGSAADEFDDEMTAIIRNLAETSGDPVLLKLVDDLDSGNEEGSEVLDALRGYDEAHFGPLE